MESHPETAYTASEPGQFSGGEHRVSLASVDALPKPERLASYLNGLLADFRKQPSPPAPQPSDAEIIDVAFAAMLRREFTALSKSRGRRYREAICGHFARNVREGEPLRLYLDIGGGYHASLAPGQRPLSFTPGFGELLLLRQIRRFDDAIRHFYPPGTRFSLVIDNLCALLVNDIPVQRTAGYCDDLRRLIDSVGLTDSVGLLVESEHFAAEAYAGPGESPSADSKCDAAPTPAEVENVARFLGRPCTAEEARQRMVRYQWVTQRSDEFLGRVVDGVRMTQRATPGTFGFRAYPGGDCRIQAGEVVAVEDAGGRIVPRLVTSRSEALDALRRVSLAGLPAPLTEVLYLRPTLGQRNASAT